MILATFPPILARIVVSNNELKLKRLVFKATHWDLGVPEVALAPLELDSIVRVPVAKLGERTGHEELFSKHRLEV
jgi:hypothetical protein